MFAVTMGVTTRAGLRFSRGHLESETMSRARFFKKPWLFGLSRRVILYLHVFLCIHMYLYRDTCELLKGSQLINQDLMECKIGFCCFNGSTDVQKTEGWNFNEESREV